jgi:hypothetical protein
MITLFHLTGITEMIIEHRTYSIRLGEVGNYLDAYGEDGFALHEGHLGKCVGHYRSEVGPQSQLVMMWAFDDFNQRMERKAKLDADPAWTRLLNEELVPRVEGIDTKLLIPNTFWPMK